MAWNFVFFFALSSAAALAAPQPGEIAYYGKDFFESKSNDEALKQKLFAILNGSHSRKTGEFDQISERCSDGSSCFQHTPIGYDGAREALLGSMYLVSDRSGYGVRDVYCEKVVYAADFRGAKPGPNKIPDATVVNTEHTWPQSAFTRAFPAEMQKSDLHHLFPVNSTVNSDRSSLDFGEVKSESKALKCGASRLGVPEGGRELVFEPPTSHKGNVARAIFYFSVRYKLSIGREQEAALRAWHRLDPVDAEERSRNEKIFALQLDRNPFVDYPELVDRIREF